MGWFGRLRGRAPESVQNQHPNVPLRQFSGGPVDEIFAQLSNQTGPVSRAEALSVPAVLRGRNLIASIATLPLQQYATDNTVVPNPLLLQLDPDVPNVVTLAQTVEDLLFVGISWWRVVGFGWDSYPVSIRRVDPSTVYMEPPVGRQPAALPSGVDPHGGRIYVDGLVVDPAELIRFDSPNPGILSSGARAIRRALLLDRAAKTYAETPAPADYFVPAPGAENLDDDEEQAFLATWRDARKRRSTAYIPASVEYHTVSSPSPKELQLVELQQQAALELANLMGLDPEELGISTTSRTYNNVNDRRRDKINETLSPYMRAITDRLSMGDVTRRGYVVRFNLDDYLRANAQERWANYQTAVGIGVLSAEEIRALEGLPPGAPTPEPAPAPEPMPTQEEATVEASAVPQHTFSAEPLRFVDLPLQTFKVDTETRTIEGVAVPYGRSAKGFRFERGSLKFADVTRVKLWREHDATQVIGVATELKDGSQGFTAKFRVARTPAGDEALALAEDGVLDGLSVGVEFTDRDTTPDPRHKAGFLVRRADLREVSLTSTPAFDDARVTRVVASLTPQGETGMPEQTEPEVQAPSTPPAAGGITLSNEQFAELMGSLKATQAAAQPDAVHGDAQMPMTVNLSQGRQFVNPVRPVATTTVTNPVSYRFNQAGSLVPAAHDFGMDLVQAAKFGRPDTPEYQRVMEFMRREFVVSTDVNELNPTINIPRYIDEREFTYPIWSAVNRGAPPNGIQPFQWPAFASASGLVGTHSEGVEPSTGTYVTTSQSVTPVALSGKCTISREVWDMGGVPGLSDILWRRIRRDWYETLENGVTATLDNASPTSLGLFTTGGGTTGQTLVAEMRNYLSRLQFVRGGARFDTCFSQQDLYAALVNARDADGRALLAAVSPVNADGSPTSKWGSIDVNGVAFLPAWSLGASGTVAESSYLIDRTAVDAWATEPQRIDIALTEVRFVHIGVWGYHASAINDLAGVREVIYDPI